MKIASVALMSALAAILGCAQPALAQTRDQTGAANQGSGNMNNDAHTTGADRGGMSMGRNGDDRQGSMRDDNDDQDAAERNGGGNWSPHRQWSERRPMMMGPMWRHRRMMMGMGGAGGARFHFARGKARIDVTCSVQEDTEACVRAAGQLLDKIARLRGGGSGDTTTGSAGDEDRPGTAPSSNAPDETGAPGERM